MNSHYYQVQRKVLVLGLIAGLLGLSACGLLPAKVVGPTSSLANSSNTEASTPLPAVAKEYSSLASLQKKARFSLLLPQSLPQDLVFSRGWISDSVDGTETVHLVYSEPGDPLDANLKVVDIFQSLSPEPVTSDSLSQADKETALGVIQMQVRGRTGFAYWEQSVAAGNSAHLAWREGGVNFQIVLFGNWPAPTAATPHPLDSRLQQIAASLQSAH